MRLRGNMKKKIFLTIQPDEYIKINESHLKFMQESNKVISLQEFIRIMVIKSL